MGAIDGIGSKRDATCVSCGNTFQYHPCNSAGKYCSHECMRTHKLRLSASTGMYYRKLLLRAGVHSESSALRVWAVMRKASPSAQLVVIRDLIMERESVKAEIERVAKAMLPEERAMIEAECKRLENLYHGRISIMAQKECPSCKTIIGWEAARCYRCGTDIPENEERSMEAIKR